MEKRTKKEIIKSMSVKRVAWDHAVEMIVPILEDHKLQEYKVNAGPFNTGSTMTKVDQNVDHIIHVAEWLLEPLT